MASNESFKNKGEDNSSDDSTSVISFLIKYLDNIYYSFNIHYRSEMLIRVFDRKFE